MNTAIVKHTGIETLGTGMTVLGERQVRIPVGGKIRSGIMVLTATGKQHPKAQGIYDAGVKAGKAWSAIDKELREACKFEKSPLTPKNVPYFTVRSSDFVSPQAATQIMQLYGSDGIEGFRLYRFPVVFPVDAWPAVMPHGLHCYTRRELVYWSEYGMDGKRYCYTRAPLIVDKQSKRAPRQFGGRPVVLRQDNEGLCLPEKCPEYQAKKCNLDGSLLFYIPGIAGMSAVELPTKSFYSLDAARRKLEMVGHLRAGKISGTVDGKPFFYITKKLEEVAMLDEQGQPKKVKQWLIMLEVDIDMTKVFAASEKLALEAGGTKAVAALEAPAIPPDNATDGEATSDDEEAPPVDEPPPAATGDLVEKVKAARQKVLAGLTVLDVTPEKFSAYAVPKWGPEWSRTLEGLAKAEAIIQQAADDSFVLDSIRNHGN